MRTRASILKPVLSVQGDIGGKQLWIVDYDLDVPQSTDSAVAAANWAEIAEQLGNIKELQQWSQQCVFADHLGHPV